MNAEEEIVETVGDERRVSEFLVHVPKSESTSGVEDPKATGASTLLDEIFGELSEAFAGRLHLDGDIVHPERLERQRLDYSLASLDDVDRYLEYVSRHLPDEGPPRRNTVRSSMPT